MAINPAETARKMESDAVAFYKKAAEMTSHPVGKKIFLSIMEDEVRHIKMVDDLVKGLGIAGAPADPMKKVKTIFAEMKADLQKRVTATTDDKEALKIAMGMEKEGAAFYKKTAAEATDPKVRELFTRLEAEESKHYQIFSNTYSFLNDTGNWFMWDEHSIVEG